LGVRLAFLRDWSYEVVTLGCHVVHSHTARAVAEHVSSLLKKYFFDLKSMRITSCHDGADNMVAASKLLKVDNFCHCTAHALHLLLTVDSLNRIDDAVEIIQKCRNIVTCIHFKTVQLEDEISAAADKALISKLQSAMADVNEVLEMDDQISLDSSISNEGESSANASHFTSLKLSCPTRWNSTLRITSILGLRDEVQNLLKRIGHSDLCLHNDELDVLSELAAFLHPFEEFTALFSCLSPSLSLIPVMKNRIKKLCSPQHKDGETIKAIKVAVLAKVDYRFPESENMMLHQVLDSGTKKFVDRQVATTLLGRAFRNACDRKLITGSRKVNREELTMFREDDGVHGAGAQSSVSSDSCDPVQQKKRLRLMMLNEMRAEATMDDNDDLAMEIAHYLSRRFDFDCVLQFWKSHSTLFPNLSRLADIHLATSSTSVPVESTFSLTVLIANSRQSRLNALKLHKILYVHDNHKFAMGGLQ
jgi:hypothetical protein